MKIQSPQINSLDELLDLITHPEKLTKILQQLAEMRDAVNVSLGIYATKEKADDYLGQAQSKMDQARDTLADAAMVRQKALEIEQRAKQELASAQIQSRQMESSQAQKTKDLQFLAQSLDERGRVLAARADELDARAAAITEATTSLCRKQAMLDDEVKKMSDRIAAFHAV